MGILSLFKKTFSSNPAKDVTIDFANIYGESKQNIIIRLSDCTPGSVLIDEMEIMLGADYIDDVGFSSDGKYRKIFTPHLSLWVRPNDFSNVWTGLNNAREAYIHTFTIKDQVTFERYLGHDKDFFTVPYIENIADVSHSFGYPASSIISKLPEGARLSLNYYETQSTDVHIAVLTQNGQQIGWLPISIPPTPPIQELISQLKSGVPQEAIVSKTGKIQDKDIWWCEVKFDIKVPYDKNSACVYIAPSGYRYHKTQTCNRAAATKIPLEFAVRSGYTPCGKCHKGDTT